MDGKRNRKKIWYQNNREQILDKKKKKVSYIRGMFKSIKAEHGCIICGEKDPSCIEFHHIDKETKEFGISDAIRNGYSIQRILNELAKCIPVCSNCHKKIHKDDSNGNGGSGNGNGNRKK